MAQSHDGEFVPARPHWAGTAVTAMIAVVAAAAVFTMLARSCSLGGGHQMGSMAAAPTTVQDEGLRVVHEGYRLEVLRVPAKRGKAEVAFRIRDRDGSPLTEYELGHTKKLHLYVLRDDMSAYQHLHPSLHGDTWRTTITVPDGGLYRLYVEFLPKGRQNLMHPTVLGAPFTIPGDTTFVPLPPPRAGAKVDGLTVRRLDGTRHLPVKKLNVLRFRITDRAGKPVDRLDTYLGAYAHLSAFHSLTMGLLHQHPTETAVDGLPGGAELSFRAQFATRGEHRLFLQFRVDGKVRQTAFTVFVT